MELTLGRMALRDEAVAARILLAGDLCPIRRLNTMLAAGDVDGAFGDTRTLFAQADVSIVNLESPLCTSEDRLSKVGPNFRADPRVAQSLTAAGVDVCCLANNHVMDFGAAGLHETLRVLDAAGIRHVGASADQTTAGGPLLLEAGGVRMALLNVGIVEGAVPRTGPGAMRLDRLALRRAVAQAATAERLTIPIVHAGREEVLFPSPGMRTLGRELIDAGAAAVVAHHPHVPQGIEIYRGRPIAYSLGNFLFDWHEPEPHTDTSFLLELGVSPHGVCELVLHPFRKSAVGGAQLLKGSSKADYLALLNDISTPLLDAELHQRLWAAQCRTLLHTAYAARLMRGAYIASDDPAARLKAQLTFLNLMEDDEHGDVIKQALLEAATGAGGDDAEIDERLKSLMARLCAFAKAPSPE
jgi:poly-gamma-glutamate synthesis protein (capsule biosynthesis protein)